MIRRLLLLTLATVAYASCGWAQDISVRYQGQLIGSRGVPLASQNIAVCTQPAVTSTQPCSPLATLATSTTTSSGGANPLTTDSNGNFFFYAAPGKYTVQAYGPQVSGQFVQPDTLVGVTGPATIVTLNKVQKCETFAGATADVKIAACIAALPAGGGTADATGFGAGTQSIAATVSIASTTGHVHLELDKATIFQPASAALNMFTIGQNGSINGLTVQVNNQTNYSGTVVQMLSGADGTRAYLTNYLICNGTQIQNGPCKGIDSQTGTGTAVSFNAVTGVNASFFNFVLNGTTVGFRDAYLFTANGASGSFYASNSNILDKFGAKNPVNCIHFNSNPGDILGNALSGGECEAASGGTVNSTNCILTDGTGANLSGNFINSTNCWDYGAATTEVNFSGTTATRNWFNIQDRNLGATPLVDNSTVKTNNVWNIGQNAAGNDWALNLSGNFFITNVGNGTGIKVKGPDTQWNIQQHVNATGDLCFTLSGVAVESCMTNTEIYPNTAGALNLGKAANPFGNLFLGTAATNNFKFQPAVTTGARIIAVADPVSPTTVGLPLTIASGTATMTTAAIASQACGTVVTVAATGALTTDRITTNDNAQPAAATNGVLIIKSWPTANNVNFFYCNPTAASVTPAAATLNWGVIR